MFKAGVEFALGLGVGCLLLYGIFLCASFIWFEVDQQLFERSRRRRTEGPQLIRPDETGLATQLSPVEKAVPVDVGASAR